MLNLTLASTSLLTDLETTLRGLRDSLFNSNTAWFWYGLCVVVILCAVNWKKGDKWDREEEERRYGI